jgi:Methylamine utilisation protein MauE
MIADPVFSATMAGFLALLLATASWFKLADLTQFEATLAAYRVLPSALLPVFARLVPVLEALAVVSLVYAPTQWLGLAFAAGLLTLYALAMAINLRRGRNTLECGCGGLSQSVSWFLVLRNLGCAAVALGLAMTRAMSEADSTAAHLSLSDRSMTGVDLFTVVLASLCLFALYVLGNQWSVQADRARSLAVDFDGRDAS